MQLLPSVTGRLVVHHFARGLARLRSGDLAFPLGDLPCLNLSGAARFFLGAALAVFFVAASAALFFLARAVLALLLQPFRLRTLDRGLGLFLGLALLVDF